ncbi:glycosyl transferase [Parapedobacter defluvii]|uniref:Peptide O-xylosyltransferase n=1 Tax=Parapedobacter defluvii TaxID=2045106 RepID=A0ABQ1MXK5_9SPHI|nr:beta-1,6-N-acetylglucosaminyltransferase [Parapedobacter defluvii]GGC48763.1 glycosyl transferase [Parapedobacter defluvii]
MAKIANLILGHRHPKQLSRLVSKITYPNSTVYIHIDKKISIEPFFKQLDNLRQVKFIINRETVTWGAFSMVQATLNSIHEIIENEPACEFINLLSESDYPLKNTAEIDDFFNGYLGKSFMDMHFRDSFWWHEAQKKIGKYHFVNYHFRGRYLLERLVNSVTPRRKLPLGMAFTGHSQWWTLSVCHIQYILEFVERNPKVIQFFKHTWGADEFFFQTILFNSPHKDDIINNNLRYIEWEKGKESPNILNSKHFQALANSGKLYARKFDTEVDSEILDLIDLRLLKNNRLL